MKSCCSVLSYLIFEGSFVASLRKIEDSNGDSDRNKNETTSNEPPGYSHVQFFGLDEILVDVSFVTGTRHGLIRYLTSAVIT
jgi:hypothetical protein